MKDFENIDQINDWLRVQWAGLLADFIQNKSSETSLSALAEQISDLNNTSKALKRYTEKILESSRPQEASKIVKVENEKIQQFRIITKFKHETLISFILSMANSAGDKNELSTGRIYREFIKSNDIESFVNSLDIPSLLKASILKIPKAHDDYTRISKIYKSDQQITAETKTKDMRK